MNDQEMLKNKPEGSTHVDGVFLKHVRNASWKVWSHTNKTWQQLKLSGINHYKDIRSIADIEEIESLRAQLKTATADGMIEVANQCCPVSGFVVSSEKSRLEILDYAESLSKGKDCE